MADILGGAFSLGTSIINNYAEDKRAQIQREWNEDMMNLQHQWDLEMFDKTNQYNSPGAQLQRLRDAGLNPLYFGLDGSSANSIQNAQPLGYERASSPGLANPYEAALKSDLQIAQLNNINQDTALKGNQTLSEVERRLNLQKERDLMNSKIDYYKQTANLTQKEAEKLDTYAKYADQIYQAMIDKDQAYIDLTKSQKDRIEKLLPGEIELQHMTVEDFKKKWKKWNAEIDHLAKQDTLLAKQARYYLVSLLSNGAFGTGISAINSLVLDLIEEDPDLTPKEREKIKEGIARGFNMSSKSKGRFFQDLSDSYNVPDNYLGPAFGNTY